MEHEQKVIGVLNELLVWWPRTTPKWAWSGCSRRRRPHGDERRARGTVLQQAAKANATRHVADTLGLSAAETVQYLKLQALKAHPSANTVVGVGDPSCVLRGGGLDDFMRR